MEEAEILHTGTKKREPALCKELLNKREKTEEQTYMCHAPSNFHPLFKSHFYYTLSNYYINMSFFFTCKKELV